MPVEHIIGEEGMGFTYQMIQFQVSVGIFDHMIQIGAVSSNNFCFHIPPFQEERLAAAAGCLVPLSTILEETIAYTKVSHN